MPRLKKKPALRDYVVERISSEGVIDYLDFDLRSDARAEAKDWIANGGKRARIFHVKFEMVQDTKPKKK